MNGIDRRKKRKLELLKETEKSINYMSLSIRKDAFTLAEILITIAVIGIVAVLTLPDMIIKYKKHVTVTKVKRAYSQISQAVKMSEAQNGELKSWNFNLDSSQTKNTELFVEKYIKPYLKDLQYCGNGDDTKRKCGMSISHYGKNYLLPDGTGVSLVIQQNVNSEVPMLIDTNNRQGPNIIGKDVFYFYLTNEGVYPFLWHKNITREEIINGIKDEFYEGTYACRKNNNDTDTPIDIMYQYNLYLCTALIYYDGWQIKDDYPW